MDNRLAEVDQRRLLDYEVRASWWASWISNDKLQDLTASYFAWKVRRKYARWRASVQNSKK